MKNVDVFKTCSCGSTEFILIETLTHNANIDTETFNIECKNVGNEITLMTCKKCSKDYPHDDFINNEINFD